MAERKAENNLQIEPPSNIAAVIRVVGVGGGGCNAVNRMIQDHAGGIDFIAINTDHQDLDRSVAPTVLQIGDKVTRGLGAGADPEKGEMAANESRDEIAALIKGTDLLFVTAGMGGGTGTGAAPVIAQIARDMGILTVAVVTRPFSFEGAARTRNANAGIQKLESLVDALVIVANDKLLSLADQDMEMDDAFKFADKALQYGVAGIADLVSVSGNMNLDMNDVRKVISNAGICHMGVGNATGADRAQTAINLAIHNPLLDTTIDGASRILIQYVGNNIKLQEMHLASSLVREAADPDAEIITGYVTDPSMGEQLVITVIASGFKKPGEAHRKEVLSSATEAGSNGSASRMSYPSFLSNTSRVPLSSEQSAPEPSASTLSQQAGRTQFSSFINRESSNSQGSYTPLTSTEPGSLNYGGQGSYGSRQTEPAPKKKGGLSSWLFSEQDGDFED